MCWAWNADFDQHPTPDTPDASRVRRLEISRIMHVASTLTWILAFHRTALLFLGLFDHFRTFPYPHFCPISTAHFRALSPFCLANGHRTSPSDHTYTHTLSLSPSWHARSILVYNPLPGFGQGHRIIACLSPVSARVSFTSSLTLVTTHSLPCAFSNSWERG